MSARWAIGGLVCLFCFMTRAAETKVRHAEGAKSGGETAKRVDKWTGKVANFSGHKGKPVFRLWRNKCNTVKDPKNKDEVSSVVESSFPKEKVEIAVRLGQEGKPLKPSRTHEDRSFKIYGNTVCVEQGIQYSFDKEFAEKEVAELTFETPQGSDWMPGDVGWVAADGKVYSLNGVQDCTGRGKETDGTGIKTGYALQAMGYHFRGHSIDLPVEHLDNRGAGWRVQGPGVVGAFVKNATLKKAEFFQQPTTFRNDQTTKNLVGGVVQVEDIRWNFTKDTKDKINDKVAETKKSVEEGIAELERQRRLSADDRKTLVRLRKLAVQLRSDPAVSVSANDQKLTPGESELFLVYDRRNEEADNDDPKKAKHDRPVFWHTVDGKPDSDSPDNPRGRLA